MISISLCMIVRDEEKVIARCLDSVKGIFDEIIIVDTGSKDNTKIIAKKYTEKIYDFVWIDDFSAARNFSFSLATMEYIFWLDADDVILDEDREKLLQLKNTMKNDVDVAIMKYNLTNSESGEVICSFPRERLLKTDKKFLWHDNVHEYIILSGKIIQTDIAITHKSEKKKRSNRNLSIIEKMLADGKPLSHRNTFYYARELFLNQKYDKAIEYYNKFLQKDGGLTSNYIDSCLDLSYCFKTKNDLDACLKLLIKSFEYDSPRGEVCCRIGSIYKESGDYYKSIKWFTLATQLSKPEGNITSVIHDMYGYIPYMELSSCYYKLGEYKKAFIYNEKAGYFKPDSKVYKNNRLVLKKALVDNEKKK